MDIDLVGFAALMSQILKGPTGLNEGFGGSEKSTIKLGKTFLAGNYECSSLNFHA
ncbi:hypothetical protein [Antarcticibacterium arcticum]|uniref:hypothetical protein n=1 Tax=Antarcticibacterium arcticum TaxID=2585771 RepID=UPI00143DFE68|nr:hypothetical protein [Antarcticibacterium arcticum]